MATTTEDSTRWVWRLSALAAVFIGWMFILWHNNFHITAPVVFILLGFAAGVATIYALFRTGASMVSASPEDDQWDEVPHTAHDELEREKRTLLKAIKEAEFDHQMGKLSKRDVDEMIRGYRLRAIQVIKLLEGEGGGTAREQIEREVRARIEVEEVRSKIERAHADMIRKQSSKKAQAAAAAAARSAAAAGAPAAVVQRVAAQAAANVAAAEAAAEAAVEVDDTSAAAVKTKPAADKAAAKAEAKVVEKPDEKAATTDTKAEDKAEKAVEKSANEKAPEDDKSAGMADEKSAVKADDKAAKADDKAAKADDKAAKVDDKSAVKVDDKSAVKADDKAAKADDKTANGEPSAKADEAKPDAATQAADAEKPAATEARS